MTFDLNELRVQLIEVEAKIKKHTPNDSYFDSLSRSFHLGMVGGSGRNTYRLNKRREAAIDRSIVAAVILTALYTKRDNLKKQIEDIENGAAAKRQESIIDRRIKSAKMWSSLKPGDELPIGNSSVNPIIAKKSRLSAITTGGTKWTAAEVIGREAAKLI